MQASSFKSFFAAVLSFAGLAASVQGGEKHRVEIAPWFPEQVRQAKLVEARHFSFAPGVEYGYGYMENLFGHAGDVHVVRIELAKAKVRPYVEEGAFRPMGKRLLTTTAAAKKTKALFSVNGGFFCWKDNPEKKLKAQIPYYRMKLDGKLLESNANGTFGLGFSADGSKVRVGRVKDDELPAWENFMAGEALHSGVTNFTGVSERAKPLAKPGAPRTLLGMDPQGKYVYVFVTGGRKCGKLPSWGLDYGLSAELVRWFGCSECVNMDGGGSTTLAVRKSALGGVRKPYTPEAREAGDYIILNATSDGSERAVLDHIQFLDAKSVASPSRE